MRATALAAGLIAAVLGAATSAAAPGLSFRRAAIDLPGPPAAVIPADLDGDGQGDLIVAVAYDEWGSIGFERVEDAVEVSQVVPALLERRELRFYRFAPDGTATLGAPPLALPGFVLALNAGVPEAPVLALTDDGLDALRVVQGAAGWELRLEHVLSEQPLLAGTRTFLAGLEFVRDLDGDGHRDLVVPVADGLHVYRGDGRSFSRVRDASLRLPGDVPQGGTSLSSPHPLGRVEDVTGDGIADLVVAAGGADRPEIYVIRGLGGAKFGPAVRLSTGCLGLGDRPEPRKRKKKREEEGEAVRETPWSRSRALVYFGDLDGDGLAEAVTRISEDTGKGRFAQIKDPAFVYRFHEVSRDLVIRPEPTQELAVVGYAVRGDFWTGSSSLFRDLDGDGRKEMVALSADFSLFQILRAITAKKMTVRWRYHIYAAGDDGRYREVADARLADTARIDLGRFSLGKLAQFSGDFDGDGRVDFLHVGPGKRLSVSFAREGCRYPPEPDAGFELAEEPEDLFLLRVQDLDGDGRSDLRLTRTLAAPESGVTAATRIDLYLSGGSR